MKETSILEKSSTPLQKESADSKPPLSIFLRDFKKLGTISARIGSYILVFALGGAVFQLGSAKIKEHRPELSSSKLAQETSSLFDNRLSDFEKNLNIFAKDFQNLRNQHSSRLDELASQVSSLIENQKNQSSPNVTTVGKDFSNLETRLKSLEDKVSQSSSSTITNSSSELISDLHILNDKFQKLESALASHLSLLEENSSSEQITSSRDVSEINLIKREEFARVSKALEALTASKEERDKSLALQGQTVEKLVKDLEETQTILNQQKTAFLEFTDVVQKIEPLRAHMTEFAQQFEGYRTKLSLHETYFENLQILFAFFDLKKSIEKGRSYAGELQALSKTSSGKLDLKVLETYQNEGVPTLEEIKYSSLSVFPLKSPIEERPSNGSLWETFVKKASSIVQIRRIGISAIEDESLSRENYFYKAVAENRFEDALEAAEKLPPERKALISDWYKKLFSRVTVDRSLTHIEKELKEKIISQGFSPPLSSGP